jgi:hypothetical protein
MGPQHHAATADDAMNKWEISLLKGGIFFFVACLPYSEQHNSFSFFP